MSTEEKKPQRACQVVSRMPHFPKAALPERVPLSPEAKAFRKHLADIFAKNHERKK